jgi:hypothetical protein
MHITRSVSVAALATTLLLGACGGDKKEDFSAHCDIAAELAAAGETAPTSQQIARLRATAPDEIKDEINTAADIVAARINAGESDVFEDARLEKPIGKMQAFDKKHCDNGD